MSTKEYFRKPYMTQGVKKHSDYMKAVPQKAIDVQGQIAPNIEFKKPYDFHPNTAQMIHYYSNQLHYMGGDPVPPLNDPSLLQHAPVVVVEEEGTINPSPASGLDDGGWGVGFWATPTNTSINLGKDGVVSTHAFICFHKINIPNGATISSAILTLTGYIPQIVDNCNVTIYGNDTNNANPPITWQSAEALVLTGSSVDWSGIEHWVGDEKYVCPNIKSIIQEIIDRAGWVSGNNIMVIIRDNSSADSANRTFCSFDNTVVANRPKLEIVWE